jgi:hypothetical protein
LRLRQKQAAAEASRACAVLAAAGRSEYYETAPGLAVLWPPPSGLCSAPQTVTSRGRPAPLTDDSSGLPPCAAHRLWQWRPAGALRLPPLPTAAVLIVT